MSERIEQREDGVLIAVAGSSRWGKTAWVLQQLRGAQRIIVRDPRMEYVAPLNARRVDSVQELAALLREAGQYEGRFCYTGPDSGFDALCRLAYAWGMLWPMVFVCEENSDVTNSGKAPAGWGELMRKGLYYGNVIYSITQRPAESDKTVWGNATLKHIHGFTRPEDREYIARQMGCDVGVIEALQPLDYLEQRIGSADLTKGRVVFA